MSYDVSLLSGEGRAIDRAKLSAYLTSLGLVSDATDHFVFLDSGKICADADLVWTEDDEDRAETGDAVNCIQVHIPYALCESHSTVVLQTCEKLASHFDLRVYDEQEGKYLR